MDWTDSINDVRCDASTENRPIHEGTKFYIFGVVLRGTKIPVRFSTSMQGAVRIICTDEKYSSYPIIIEVE